MTEGFKPLLTARYAIAESHRIQVAEQHGVYRVAQRAFRELRPEQVAEEVKKANLRGYGSGSGASR